MFQKVLVRAPDEEPSGSIFRSELSTEYNENFGEEKEEGTIVAVEKLDSLKLNGAVP